MSAVCLLAEGSHLVHSPSACVTDTDLTVMGSRWWNTGYGPDSRRRPDSQKVKWGCPRGASFICWKETCGRNTRGIPGDITRIEQLKKTLQNSGLFPRGISLVSWFHSFQDFNRILQCSQVTEAMLYLHRARLEVSKAEWRLCDLRGS